MHLPFDYSLAKPKNRCECAKIPIAHYSFIDFEWFTIYNTSVGYVRFEVICMTERREIRKGQRTQNFYQLKICNSEILSTSIKILVTPLRTHKIGSGRFSSPLRWAQLLYQSFTPYFLDSHLGDRLGCYACKVPIRTDWDHTRIMCMVLLFVRIGGERNENQ